MSDLDSRTTKKSTDLTLPDKLSRLSYAQTLKLLGSNASNFARAPSGTFGWMKMCTWGRTCSAFSFRWEQLKVNRRVLP
jgi:hypothetical protein